MGGVKLLDDLLRDATAKLEAVAERGGVVVDGCSEEELERINLRLFTVRRHVQTISDRAVAAMR